MPLAIIMLAVPSRSQRAIEFLRLHGAAFVGRPNQGRNLRTTIKATDPHRAGVKMRRTTMSYSGWQVEEFKRLLAELVKNGGEAGMDGRNIAGALQDAADDMARQCGYTNAAALMKPSACKTCQGRGYIFQSCRDDSQCIDVVGRARCSECGVFKPYLFSDEERPLGKPTADFEFPF
jgi:hypothetical protein